MKNLRLQFIIILCSLLENIYPTSFINPSCLPWDTTCLATLAQRIDNNFLTTVLGSDAYKLDPYEIDHFKVDHDGFMVETRNTRIHGLRNMVFDEFSIDDNTNMLRMKLHTDLLVTSLYKTNGSILYMPISGEGDMTASFKNLEMTVVAPYRYVKNANGEDLIEAWDHKFDFDVKDNAEYRLNNLYYGFSGLSEMLHFLINYNGKYVASQYAKHFMANAVEDMSRRYKTYYRLKPFKFILE